MALKAFVYDTQFPARIRSQILRLKNNVRAVDFSESDMLNGGEQYTPTSNRKNEAFNEAMEENFSPGDCETDEFQAIPEEMFERLDERIPEGFDWYVGYNNHYEDWLVNYVTDFYDNLYQSAVVSNNEEPLVLFDDNLYKPENCKGVEQTFLIFPAFILPIQLVSVQRTAAGRPCSTNSTPIDILFCRRIARNRKVVCYKNDQQYYKKFA